ncbi:hypothetical protein Ahy_A04g018376 [Arachis hypogaea]|uniref:LysM domain-containing protein n=1 Tax=Arachis hypogaea TaxID=3818 RepID=A0A445DDI2_ARAHY|nr:hypothetical protein Ahy_A04g018376 [Arachis hypogaea]
MALNNKSNNPRKRSGSSCSCSKNNIADAASWCLAFVLVSLILMCMFIRDTASSNNMAVINNVVCDEIYVVGEGETLHTIGDKCSDPFIVENNPHIHDPDDVYPGLEQEKEYLHMYGHTCLKWKIRTDVVSLYFSEGSRLLTI